jgi:hypothetical protein
MHLRCAYVVPRGTLIFPRPGLHHCARASGTAGPPLVEAWGEQSRCSDGTAPTAQPLWHVGWVGWHMEARGMAFGAHFPRMSRNSKPEARKPRVAVCISRLLRRLTGGAQRLLFP